MAEHDSPSVLNTVEMALARIAMRDRDVRAWLHVDAQGAIERARTLDAMPGKVGALHGLCIGVKDVIAVAGMPLTHNSPLFTGHVANDDAACVESLRAAGAVILGKTDTTEFAAAGRNAASANPHDFSRTPGGSSAGSAAAVADGHVPVALATQTGGSTIRPASFCGVHGFKPSWGLVSREGVKLYANSFDTVGWHARSLALCDALCAAYGFAGAQPLGAGAPLKIGFFRTPWWDAMSGDGQAALGTIADAMGKVGIVVEELEDLAHFEHLNEDHRAVLFREGAAAFHGLASARGALLHADFHERAGANAAIDNGRLAMARERIIDARRAFEAVMQDFDALLVPSAPGIAPVGRGPGDPCFNQPWTAMEAPVVNLPLARGEGGMPIGVSLVAPRYHDRRLLAVAQEIENRLAGLEIYPTDAAIGCE